MFVERKTTETPRVILPKLMKFVGPVFRENAEAQLKLQNRAYLLCANEIWASQAQIPLLKYQGGKSDISQVQKKVGKITTDFLNLYALRRVHDRLGHIGIEKLDREEISDRFTAALTMLGRDTDIMIMDQDQLRDELRDELTGLFSSSAQTFIQEYGSEITRTSTYTITHHTLGALDYETVGLAHGMSQPVAEVQSRIEVYLLKNPGKKIDTYTYDEDMGKRLVSLYDSIVRSEGIADILRGMNRKKTCTAEDLTRWIEKYLIRLLADLRYEDSNVPYIEYEVGAFPFECRNVIFRMNKALFAETARNLVTNIQLENACVTDTSEEKFINKFGIFFDMVTLDGARYLRITTKDNGRGFSSEKVRKGFVKGDTQRSNPNVHGTGVGLDFMRHILETYFEGTFKPDRLFGDEEYGGAVHRMLIKIKQTS